MRAEGRQNGHARGEVPCLPYWTARWLLSVQRTALLQCTSSVGTTGWFSGADATSVGHSASRRAQRHGMPAACMESAAAQVHAHRRSERLGRAAAAMLAVTRSFAAPRRLCQAGRTGRRDSRALVVRALAVPDQYGCASTPREWVASPRPRGAAARWCHRRHRSAAASEQSRLCQHLCCLPLLRARRYVMASVALTTALVQWQAIRVAIARKKVRQDGLGPQAAVPACCHHLVTATLRLCSHDAVGAQQHTSAAVESTCAVHDPAPLSWLLRRSG